LDGLAMLEIIDTHLDVHFPVGHHRHCLVAQIPNHLVRTEVGYVEADPERQWRVVRSVLDAVAGGDSGFRKVHLLVFPEGCLPLSHFDDMLASLSERIRPSTVTMIGLEHVALRTYRALLERFQADNPLALEQVLKDLEAGSEESAPVNLCCIFVKEQGAGCESSSRPGATPSTARSSSTRPATSTAPTSGASSTTPTSSTSPPGRPSTRSS
jgi:hypothetical protein